MEKVEAFEMWLYGRILTTSYINKVTNLKVLRKAAKELELTEEIQTRKLQNLVM